MKQSRLVLISAVLWLAIVIASFPAWTGDWIYDDWIMRSSTKMDEVADLMSVFGRTSADYLEGSAVGPSTYRPLSMASLILGRLMSDAPLPHHMVSLALHLACVAILTLLASRLRGSTVALFVAVVFGLHPVGVEAYGWINGRSDVLACFGVVLAAYGLLVAETMRSRLLLALAGSTVVVFSKETAVVALLGLSLATLIPSGATQPRGLRRDVVLPVLVCWSVMGVFVFVRAGLIAGSSAGPGALFDAPGTWTALLRLFAVAAESVLIPAPRTMANLGYALSQPIGLAGWLSLFACAVLCAYFVRRARFRSLVLVGFAALSVAPCVMLRHSFWHGLDRYLYIPLLLTCLAWVVVEDGSQRNHDTALTERLMKVGALLLTVMLAAGTWLTSQTYRDTPKHMASMVELRPTDPTGYILGARWLWSAGQQESAQAFIDRIPHEGLPAPIASTLATLLSDMGRHRAALDVVEDMAKRFPDDPYVLLDVVSVQLAQKNLDVVFDSVRRLGGKPRFCEAARQLLVTALQHGMDNQQAQRIQRVLANEHCASR